MIDGYIVLPYDFILKLISFRRNTDEVTCGIYDALIYENMGDEAGMWVCCKIDFIYSMGLADEANKYMVDEIQYPEVCLKYYKELLDADNWREAIILLVRAQAISYIFSKTQLILRIQIIFLILHAV